MQTEKTIKKIKIEKNIGIDKNKTPIKHFVTIEFIQIFVDGKPYTCHILENGKGGGNRYIGDADKLLYRFKWAVNKYTRRNYNEVV
ncbi:MAG: hypothetical protein Unbinned2990contig1001_46 [Prokaryotic dsDNA virus sp.]|nr:MAG: hypothetical protein Unbinned2990contig1001_46 [Prokaryotic dsDNA virus sp.]